MPHIFPRRFLRTRDVLDPTEFNEDIHPVYNTLSGRLDRMNFNKSSLKGRLYPHPNKKPSTSAPDNFPSVAAGAYFKTHVSQIESRYDYYRTATATGGRPPNFVKPDGLTFRRNEESVVYSGVNPRCFPSIIPNNGEWSALKNEDLSDTQKITFTSGRAKLWISAYAQYIWQGFYEYKPPWITGVRRYLGAAEFDFPDTNNSWRSAFHFQDLPKAEFAVMNVTDPAENWEFLPDPSLPNHMDYVETRDYNYSFPLNEAYDLREERVQPNNHGYHHISQGNQPCRVQFALRIDGKIIEETITGKRIPTEESTHGMKVTDSIRRKEKDEFVELLKLAGYEESDDAEAITRELDATKPVFGQYSFATRTAFGDRTDSRPGQKLKSANATGLGPEVMPIRLGAVIDLEPGEHTVEIVARRLTPRKGTFGHGDFVGVFSRRLLAFELPITPIRQESVQDDKLPNIFAFDTESKVTKTNLGDRVEIADQINNIQPTYIDSGVFSNEYLPSKVVYSHTKTISSDLTIDDIQQSFSARNSLSAAAFSGWTSKIDTVIDHTLLISDTGWYALEEYFDIVATDNVGGWSQLKGLDGVSTELLSIVPDELIVRPEETVVLMMDVELLGIEPIESDAVKAVRREWGTVDAMGEARAKKFRKNLGWYFNFLLSERYLDLFALFAIGYKKDGNWVIGSESVPATVNSFNWVNRGPTFSSSDDFRLCADQRELRLRGIMDGDPKYNEQKSTVAKVLKFFSSDTTVGSLTASEMAELPPIMGRGDNLHRSNLGVTIPIMQVITNTTDSDMNITEFGGFVCSAVPERWRRKDASSPLNPKKYRDKHPDDVGTYPTPSEGTGSDMPDIEDNNSYDWLAPSSSHGTVEGRDILKGVQVHYRNARLTAFKVIE